MGKVCLVAGQGAVPVAPPAATDTGGRAPGEGSKFHSAMKSSARGRPELRQREMGTRFARPHIYEVRRIESYFLGAVDSVPVMPRPPLADAADAVTSPLSHAAINSVCVSLPSLLVSAALKSVTTP